MFFLQCGIRSYLLFVQTMLHVHFAAFDFYKIIPCWYYNHYDPLRISNQRASDHQGKKLPDPVSKHSNENHLLFFVKFCQKTKDKKDYGVRPAPKKTRLVARDILRWCFQERAKKHWLCFGWRKNTSFLEVVIIGFGRCHRVGHLPNCGSRHP